MKNKILATALSLAVCCGVIVSPVRATGGEAAEEREVVVVRHYAKDKCITMKDNIVMGADGYFTGISGVLAEAIHKALNIKVGDNYHRLPTYGEDVEKKIESMYRDKNDPDYGVIVRGDDKMCDDWFASGATGYNSSVVSRFKTDSLNYDTIRGLAIESLRGRTDVSDEDLVDSRFSSIDDISFVEDDREFRDDCLVVMNIYDWGIGYNYAEGFHEE